VNLRKSYKIGERMQVKREVVRKRLTDASIALTVKEVFEQSSCFVFNEGELVTFDGEVLTRAPSPFNDEITGAVRASDFLKMLQRFPDDEVDISTRGNELIIKGRRRRAGITLMSEILLPYDQVPRPGTMKKVNKDLQESLLQCARVCGQDETAPKTTHVHIAKDRVEATDSYRVLQYTLSTGFPGSVLLHASSVFAICKQNLVKVGVDKNEGWCHFQTDDKMIISAIVSREKYYDKEMIDEFFEVEGETVSLPKNLVEILDRASVMDTPSSSIGDWESQVTLSFSEGQLKVSSRKDGGWFRETKRIKYDGPDIVFTIHPLFLKELIKKTYRVIISKERMLAVIDGLRFVASLEAQEKDD